MVYRGLAILGRDCRNAPFLADSPGTSDGLAATLSVSRSKISLMTRGSKPLAILMATAATSALAIGAPTPASAGTMSPCGDVWRFGGEYRATHLRYAASNNVNCHLARRVAARIPRMGEPAIRRGTPVTVKPGGAMFTCQIPRRTYRTVYFDGAPFASISVRCRWWEWGGPAVIRFTKNSKIWD